MIKYSNNIKSYDYNVFERINLFDTWSFLFLTCKYLYHFIDECREFGMSWSYKNEIRDSIIMESVF